MFVSTERCRSARRSLATDRASAVLTDGALQVPQTGAQVSTACRLSTRTPEVLKRYGRPPVEVQRIDDIVTPKLRLAVHLVLGAPIFGWKEHRALDPLAIGLVLGSNVARSLLRHWPPPFCC